MRHQSRGFSKLLGWFGRFRFRSFALEFVRNLLEQIAQFPGGGFIHFRVSEQREIGLSLFQKPLVSFLSPLGGLLFEIGRGGGGRSCERGSGLGKDFGLRGRPGSWLRWWGDCSRGLGFRRGCNCNGRSGIFQCHGSTTMGAAYPPA